MTRLREQMTADLGLRGLSERTQQADLRAVRQLADHYGSPPDQLDERVESGAAAKAYSRGRQPTEHVRNTLPQPRTRRQRSVVNLRIEMRFRLGHLGHSAGGPLIVLGFAPPVRGSPPLAGGRAA